MFASRGMPYQVMIPSAIELFDSRDTVSFGMCYSIESAESRRGPRDAVASKFSCFWQRIQKSMEESVGLPDNYVHEQQRGPCLPSSPKVPGELSSAHTRFHAKQTGGR